MHPAPSPSGVWALARQVRAALERDQQFERSESWARQMYRISSLPEEIGLELDRLGASFRQARTVAYAKGIAAKDREMDTVRADLARKPRAMPPLRALPVLREELVLPAELPPSLQGVPIEDLRWLLHAALRKGGEQQPRKRAVGE